MVKIPRVQQFDSSDCGVACAVSMAKWYGRDVTITELRQKMGTDARGTTIRGICMGLEDLGFETFPIFIRRDSFENDDFTLPAIARLINKDGTAHFVVVYQIKRGKVLYMDPAFGEVKKKTTEEFYKTFDGQLIMAVPNESFERKSFGKEMGFFSSMKMIVWPHKKLFIVAICTSVLLTLVGIIMSIFNKTLVDELIPYQQEDQLKMLALVLLVISITSIMLEAFRTHVLLYLSQKIDIPMTLGYFTHIFKLPLSFFASRNTGDLITRFQDSGTVKDILTSTALSALIDVCMIVIIGIVLFKTNAKLLMIALIMTLMTAALIYLFKKTYKKLNRESMEQASKLNSKLIESLTGIETVKSNSCEQHFLDEIESEFIKTLKIGFRSSVTSNVQGSINSAINRFGSLLITVMGGLMVMRGDMTLGTMIAFTSLLGYFTDPVSRLVTMQLSIQEADISLKRLQEIYSLDEEEETELGKEDSILDKEFKDIKITDVVFRYGSRPLTLKGISMEIRKGEKVAVVGRSGCGKTTLTKLLLKFYLPETGVITYNDVELKDLNAFALRKSIGYVPQFTQTFSGSIKDNLVLGLDGISEGFLDQVCEITGCKDFISKLPAGYDTGLDANGGGLSGGEKQRLSIARALLRKPKFIIFDEATSNMDFITEKKTYELMFGRLKDLTALIIAHRLSTIRRCDRIYVMDGGKIVEVGTHDELLKTGGTYAQMWNSQVGDGEAFTTSEDAINISDFGKENIKEDDTDSDNNKNEEGDITYA